MQRKFKLLATITMQHDYYNHTQQRLSDVVIQPLNSTQWLMRKYRILFRQTPNGAVLLAEYSPETDGSFQATIGIERPLWFSFVLLHKNPLFQNITGLPFFTCKQRQMYFSNTSLQLTTKAQALSNQQRVSETDLLPVFPKKFDYQLSKKYKQLHIENKEGGVVAGTDNLRITENQHLPIDLSNEADGFFSLKNKTKTVADFLALQQFPPNTLGYIDILLSPETINFIDKKEENTLNYTIHFPLRETYWQYIIVRRNNNDIKNVNIVDEQNKIRFENEKSVTSEDKVFVSKQKLPLREAGDFSFKLINSNGKPDFQKVIFEKLPYPPVNNIQKHPAKANEFYSQVFVYV